MIRLRAAVWGVVALALGAGCVAVLSRPQTPVQTDLLALLPVTERDPVVERAVSGLADAASRRLVFLVGHASPAQAKLLTERFAKSLSTADVFKTVRAQFPLPDAVALRNVYLPHRFHLLSEEDRQALTGAAGRDFLKHHLQRRLYDPFRRGMGTPLEQDPLGSLDNFLAALPLAQAGDTLQFDDDGRLLVRDAERTYVIVFAELDGSAYDADVQQRLATALADAERGAQEMDPGVVILRTGTVHYASAGRETAERELNIIGIGSLLGIAVLLFSVFRSWRPIVLGIFSVAVGVCAAMLATIGVFGDVHIITLVFGASLTGEAVDYSIQYFAARLDAGKKWNAQRGLRAVLPAIVIAIITSILGYGALALTPFPALRQIALFAIVGLVVACLTVVLLLPEFLRAPEKRQPLTLLRVAAEALSRCQRWATLRARVILIAVLTALALPGWLLLTAQDDIRLLVSPPPHLLAQETAIRQLTGFSQSSQFFVIQAETPQQLLEREEALTPRLHDLLRSGALTRYQAVSDFVPSHVRQQQNYALWRQHVFTPAGAWQTELTAVGFKPSVIAGHAHDFRRAASNLLEPETWLKSPMSVPYRHLWIGERDHGYASVVMPYGFESVAVLERAAKGLPGVTVADKPGSVSRLFHDYRIFGAGTLLIAAILVCAVLWFRYGRAEALRGMVPTAAGMGMVLAAFGYSGTPLTLFSIMALLLVLGVSVNYVIFLREGIERRGAALLGVWLSAATTVLSFGLLAWSSTPALAQFGATLFIGITVTVLLAPLLGPLGPISRRKGGHA